jgi:hypothetical protein
MMGSISLDALRALLDMGPTEGEAWFHLPDRDLGFARHKDRNRALLLRRWGPGPIATVFPRTSSPHPDEPVNPAHNHRRVFPACWLDRDAWVVTRYPLQVPKPSLSDQSRLCSEEHAGTVAAILAVP